MAKTIDATSIVPQMTVREFAAIEIMAGFDIEHIHMTNYGTLAERAVRAADALLAALSK